MLGDLQEQRVGVVAGELAGEGREGCGRVGCEGVQHLLAQGAGLAVLEHAEPRGDAGLEREAAEQRLAEGVDRLDFQPAGGFERAGKEGAGACEPAGRNGLGGLAEGSERLPECRVVEHGPRAERPEQAVLHLGRGGLGVGQAEDLLRVGPGEEQARHPVGQDAGLARAGIGRHPARDRGGGGADLGGDGVLHHAVSGSSPSAHSPLRDRWSVSLPQVSFCGRRRAGKPLASCW